MHIIKITSASFKIILTKEDVEKYSAKYVKSDKIDSYGFFCEIKNKTDCLFDYPFDEMSVDAEFFQSKDGGGELFLTAKPHKNIHKNCFITNDSDVLLRLCKRIVNSCNNIVSRLYFIDNLYYLILTYEETSSKILYNIASEYGEFCEVSQLFEWHMSEHANCIFKNDAVENVVKKL